MQQTSTGPVFQSEWREKYLSETHQPQALAIVSGAFGLFLLAVGIFELERDDGVRTGSWGGYTWALEMYLPWCVCACVCACVCVGLGRDLGLGLDRDRRRITSNEAADTIIAIVVAEAIVATVATAAATAVPRRACRRECPRACHTPSRQQQEQLEQQHPSSRRRQ